MTTITVLKFSTEGGAEEALEVIQDLARKHLISLQDAVIVSWPVGKKKPGTKQLHNLAGAGALQGAFWGMLLGLIFFIPLFGMVVGAAMGALAGTFSDMGIDDEFVKSTREKVTEGTSALFLMTSEAVLDRVAEAMKGLDFELISTNLSREQEGKLRAVFGQ